MSVVAFRAQDFGEPRALAGIGGVELALRLTSWMDGTKFARQLSVVPSFEQLRERAVLFAPRAIFIDDEILEGARLDQAVRLLPATSHIVLLGGPGRLPEAAPLVANGALDFVERSGDFLTLVKALLERALQAELRPLRLGLPPGVESSDELSAVFRHEINNPLTGILGNAELLLAHRHQLPASETQRLQTIVELAVRLRETIRRLSNEWEADAHTTHAV